MKVTLRQIEGFLAACETRSFTRAAERLHMTQSAFSQLIRELEVGLDVKLFERTTRRLALTDVARTIAPRLAAAAVSIDEACQEARAVNRLDGGHLRVAALPTLAIGPVTAVLADQRRLHPRVTATVLEGGNAELVEAVLDMRADIAICGTVAEPPPALRFEVLFREPLVAVVARGHALARRTAVDWKTLAGEPLILLPATSTLRGQVDAAFARHGLDGRPACEVASPFTALAMARAGLGVAILPPTALGGAAASEGVASLALADPVAERHIALCRRRDREEAPVVAQFVAALREQLGR
jgi:DNA-binding transcriptional LysR family regulator